MDDFGGICDGLTICGIKNPGTTPVTTTTSVSSPYKLTILGHEISDDFKSWLVMILVNFPFVWLLYELIWAFRRKGKSAFPVRAL